jgi:hypothetical protein
LRVAIAPPSCRCIVKRVLSPRRPGGYGESAQKQSADVTGPAVGAGLQQSSAMLHGLLKQVEKAR